MRQRPFDPLLLGLPSLKLLLHLATASGYGWFRDEFYYLACAARPAAGYVDHPALSILVLKGWTAVFGDGRVAIRILPALAGALTVLLVGLLARRMGGGRLAQQLAMLGAVAAPMWLSLDHYYSMNALDLLFWALAAWLFLDVLLDEAPVPESWALLGLVLGLGLANKISVLWLGGGLALGLLLGGRARLLLTRGPWIAAALALALFAPYVYWNAANGWPTLEFMRHATGDKMARHTAFEFLANQVLAMNPATVPLWAGGLIWLLLSPKARALRPLAVAWLAVFALLAASGTSRASYLAAAYAWLFAAGGVAVEAIPLAGARRPLAWAIGVFLAVAGAGLAPLALPLLPVERYVAYAKSLGAEPSTEERKTVGELPQFFADMHGWEEIAATFAAAYASLGPEERRVAAIFARDYGVAGAVDRLGRARGLPRAISGHNNYWLWGPGGATGEVVLVQHDDDADRLRRVFGDVRLFARLDCGRCMPYEAATSVYVCRAPRASLARIWPETKHFD